MTDGVYRELVDALNERPHTMTAVPCEEFYAFVRELFTPEQAAIACGMPIEPSTLDELATMMPHVDVNTLREQLEKMAKGGVIQVVESNGVKQYQLLPLY